MRERHNLEQFAHCGAVVADQARQRLVNITGVDRPCLQGGRALFDTEPPQKLRLVYGSEAENAHGLNRPRQCLEINVCSEVEISGICQGVGEGVLADGLPGLAEAAFNMAIVDDERGTATVGDTPA
jgi:hypothetical protein